MRTGRPERARPSPIRWSLALLLLVLFVAGGSNATGLVPRLIGQIAGLILMGMAIYRIDWGAAVRRDRFAAILLGGLALLFVAQLVPLPAAVWTGLPGRAVFANGDRLMLGEIPNRPWTLDPDATITAALFLVPALGAYLLLLSGRTAGVADFFRAALVFAALTLLLGLAQALAGGDALHLYQNAHSTVPTGFFANRNHQGSLLACTIPIAAALASRGRWGRHFAQRATMSEATGNRVVLALLFGVLAMGVLLTGSRTASVLLVPAIGGGLLIAAGDRVRIGRFALVFAAIVAVVAMALFVLPKAGGPLGHIFSRGITSDEDRFSYWPAVIEAARAYFPAGSGIGTFERAYQVHEPLAQLAPLYLNHAHNDWLELWLEGGAPALALAALFVAWLIWRTIGLWRARAADAVFGRAGTVVVWLLLLHSLTDYPLRTIALSTVFAGGVAAIVMSRALRMGTTPGLAIEKVLSGTMPSA